MNHAESKSGDAYTGPAAGRMNDGGWKDEELWKLVRVLKLSAEQLAAMLGALPRPAA